MVVVEAVHILSHMRNALQMDVLSHWTVLVHGFHTKDVPMMKLLFRIRDAEGTESPVPQPTMDTNALRFKMHSSASQATVLSPLPVSVDGDLTGHAMRPGKSAEHMPSGAKQLTVATSALTKRTLSNVFLVPKSWRTRKMCLAQLLQVAMYHPVRLGTPLQQVLQSWILEMGPLLLLFLPHRPLCTLY